MALNLGARQYDKNNKIKKRYKYKKSKDDIRLRDHSSGGFFANIFSSIFSSLWSVFRPIIRLALLVAFVWGLFFSEYTSEYRSLAYTKGRLFFASLMPEPADPYESLRCQKIRTNIADLEVQEVELAQRARGGVIVGLGAAIISSLADKKETARSFAKGTIHDSAPAAEKLEILRKKIRDEKIDNLECFEREVGRGQKIGGITKPNAVISNQPREQRIIERTVIQPPQTIVIQPEKQPKQTDPVTMPWGSVPMYGTPEWERKYPTPYSR